MMIDGFYIGKLLVTGPGKKDAYIEFKKGCNIVSGPSDTGKSYLLKCINYMMGGNSPPKDINEANGYDCIWMEIFTYSGESYTLRRKIGSSELLLIEGTLPESKNAAILQSLQASHNSKREDNISAFLLKITNLWGKQLKESKNKKRPIRFTDLKTIFLKDEEIIITEKSPIFAGQYNSKVAETSLFNLLLTGEDDEDLVVIKDSKIYKTVLNTKIELTQNLVDEEKRKINTLNDKISSVNRLDLSNKIKELSRSKHLSNSIIKKQENERNQIIRKYSNVESHIIHLKELLDRFSLLDNHYYSDSQRLEFMLEGEYLLSQLPTVPCPSCGRDIESNKIKDFLDVNNKKITDSINKEMTKITVKREELSKTRVDIEEEIDEYIHIKDNLDKELKRISELIDKELLPTHQIINNDLEEYIILKQNISRLEDAEANAKAYEKEIEEYKLKLKEKPEKEQRRILPEEHYLKLCELMKKQLISWDISVKDIQFNKDKVDFVIDNKDRKNYGKGYRAILCSAFLISLMKYCWEQETYHPRMIVLDSPLTTYRQSDYISEKDRIEETVQESFYQNLASISTNFQIIVFENKDPSKYIQDKITYHHFTRNHNIGRYGFFPL